MRSTYPKRFLSIFSLLLALTLFCLLAACGRTKNPPPKETVDSMQSASDTLPETVPESTVETIPDTVPESTADSTPDTESDTASETESEMETESETAFSPDSSTSPNRILFDGESILSFIQATGCQTELYNDAEAGALLKVQASSPMNYVVFDYEAYMNAKGLTPISLESYRFAAITFQTGAAYGDSHSCSTLSGSFAAGDTEECKLSNASESTYSAKKTDFQTVLVDLRGEGTLHSFLLTATLKTRAAEYICISSISFMDSVSMDMLEAPILTEIPVKGLTKPTTVLQITDLHACAFTDEEIAAMTPARAADVRNRLAAFWGKSPYLPEDILTAIGNYAADIEADLILATGDMIDFPSEGNLALLSQFVLSSPKPVLYMAGNHDWCFSDDYMTQNAIDTYLPRITALAGAQNGVAVYDTEAMTFIAVDNSSDTVTSATVNAYLAAVSDARAKGKSVVLALHVPFTADTLVADCKRVWNRNICIGPGGISDWHEPTMALFRAVTEGTEYAPDAVISGHVHFSHEDVFPNGVPQLITADASADGTCRVIRFVPA